MAVTDYISSSQLLTAVSSILKIAESALPGYWSSVTVQAANFAEQEIKGRLLKRGYPLTDPSNKDITHWDRNYEFSRDIGLWKALILGGAYESQARETLDALNRCAEVDTVIVTVLGEWVKPSGDKPDLIRSGMMDPGGTGRFDIDEREDNYGIEF